MLTNLQALAYYKTAATSARVKEQSLNLLHEFLHFLPASSIDCLFTAISEFRQARSGGLFACSARVQGDKLLSIAQIMREQFNNLPGHAREELARQCFTQLGSGAPPPRARFADELVISKLIKALNSIMKNDSCWFKARVTNSLTNLYFSFARSSVPARSFISQHVISRKRYCANLKRYHRVFSYADLSYADLTRQDLRACNFKQADFSYSKLAGTNFTRADLSGARFNNAKMAQIREAPTLIRLIDKWLSKIACLGALFPYYGRLAVSNLEIVNLRQANLEDADLRNIYPRYYLIDNVLEAADLINTRIDFDGNHEDNNISSSLSSYSNFSNDSISECSHKHLFDINSLRGYRIKYWQVKPWLNKCDQANTMCAITFAELQDEDEIYLTKDQFEINNYRVYLAANLEHWLEGKDRRTANPYTRGEIYFIAACQLPDLEEAGK